MDFLKFIMKHAPNHVSCGKLISETRFNHPDRVIDSFVVLIGIKNKLFIQEADSRFCLDSNNSIILEPFKRHCSYAPSSNLSYYWSHFYLHPEDRYEIIGYREAVELYYMMINDAYVEKEDTCLIPKFFELVYPEKINILLHQLLDYRYGNYYAKKVADYCLSTVLTELTQQAMESFAFKYSGQSSYRLSEIMEWIRINIDKRLTVAEISETFNYNPNYLSDLFKSKTGYSLIKFINKTKISKAKELLIKTNKSLKEIAFELGFADEKYFLKLFKRYMDITPTKYKNAYFKLHMNNK